MSNRSECNPKNIFAGRAWRICVLTERLLRMEYQKDGFFEDEATQTVLHRDFPPVPVRAERRQNGLYLETNSLILEYDGEPFSPQGLSVRLKEERSEWHYGDDSGNLKGTARTLDQADGAIPLENGIFSEAGCAVIDDSDSAVLLSDHGGKEDRPPETDIYLFAYGKHFYDGLKAFYELTGRTPLIPRYALGNWWSRFYRYTEESYKDVINRFEAENIPLSVAVLDMDWHLVDDVPKEYGSGWTGYTWNRNLFPDPERFLSWLKAHGLAVTLNLHPRDGIRGFEEMYPAVAERMGVSPDSGQTIEFRFADWRFRDAYFEEVIHPYEKMGVDFWWIDWQQGFRMPGSRIDPLWMLNHFHFLDRMKSEKRPMIFSRYAGPGSHRYPIGFSGDTIVTWRSLDFQPNFTKTSSNIGYGWWSHDIGGHMLGVKDDEMLIRWVEFGVFSPIMRLHSSNNPFFVKEPWNLPEPYRTVMSQFLRLRHKLIPYLYTMNAQQSNEGKPLIRPLYYDYPNDERAYSVQNGYSFGSELLVFPITRKADPELRMAAADAYIPKGKWVDLLTGKIYEGDLRRKLYRSLETIPVLLKDGGIVPMADLSDSNGVANPDSFDLYIGCGKEGTFNLYEDDGMTQKYREGHFVTTTFTVKPEIKDQENVVRIRIAPAEGDLSLIPSQRRYRIHLMGVQQAEASYPGVLRNESVLETVEVQSDKGICIDVHRVIFSTEDWKKDVFRILNQSWIPYQDKMELWEACEKAELKSTFLEEVQEMDVSCDLKDALSE